VLTAALSGANANLYAASRMLFSLARSGHAAPALGRLNDSGSPRLALLISGIGVPLALITEHWAPRSAFLYLIGASLFGGMLAWCVALAAHIAFRRRLSAADLAALPMRAPGGAVLSAIGLAGIVLAVASTWWVPQSRITIASGLPFLAILSLAYLAVRKRWSSE
jgi:AAT family amino acid transporter